MASYPAAYENLLLDANLLMTGTVVLKGIVSEAKNKYLDEKSQTWGDGTTPIIDNRTVQCFITPSYRKGKILGDWREGLTVEQIKIINEVCHVPLFDDEYHVVLNHGRRLDLSDPTDCAIYKIAIHNDHVSINEDEVSSNHTHYFYNVEDHVKKQAEKRSAKKKAYELDNTLPINQKREIISVFYFNEGMGFPNMGDVDLNEAFTDYCDSKAAEVIRISNLADLKFRSFLIKAGSLGVISLERKGAIKFSDGRVIASNLDEATAELAKNRDLINEIDALITKRSMPKITDEVRDSVLVASKYNTTIYDESHVALWSVGACKQYLDERTISFNPVASLQDLQKLVVETHKATYNLTETSDPILNWTRKECKDYLDAEGVEHNLSIVGSGTAEWQQKVIDHKKG